MDGGLITPEPSKSARFGQTCFDSDLLCRLVGRALVEPPPRGEPAQAEFRFPVGQVGRYQSGSKLCALRTCLRHGIKPPPGRWPDHSRKKFGNGLADCGRSPCSIAIPGCLQDIVAMVASRLQARMPRLQNSGVR